MEQVFISLNIKEIYRSDLVAIITKIEEQKNKKRVNIFVDNAFFCGLNKETAVLFRLKVNSEIDTKTLEEAVLESEVKSAFEKGIDYISSRLHTKKELFDKLAKKGFEKLVIERAILKLEEYNYVNDETFAKTFVQQNQKYSKKMVENKLRQKGVSSEIIANVLELGTEEKEEELCEKQLNKLLKGKRMEDLTKEMLQKVYMSLFRKGFDYDLIKRVCRRVLTENFDEE